MFDYRTIKLMHRHGDGDWFPMEDRSHHGSPDHDPERDWLRHARILTCSRCDDAVAIVPEVPDDQQRAAGD